MENQYPDLSTLPDGEYTGMWYAHIFELDDGRMFHTDLGVRLPRKCASCKMYVIKDGRIVSN